MTYQIGWFSTGRGQGSMNLLNAMVNAISAGEVNGNICVSSSAAGSRVKLKAATAIFSRCRNTAFRLSRSHQKNSCLSCEARERQTPLQ